MKAATEGRRHGEPRHRRKPRTRASRPSGAGGCRAPMRCSASGPPGWRRCRARRAGAGPLPAAPWWQMTTDDVLGGALAAGAKQLNDALAKDPFLRSVDRMWNANPLRDIVPVDWAEIARALRTVWLRSLRRTRRRHGRGGGAEREPVALGPGRLERGRPALVGRGGAGGGGGAARPRRRQALRRAGVAHEPRLPHAEGGLPARLRLAAASRARRRRTAWTRRSACGSTSISGSSWTP